MMTREKAFGYGAAMLMALLMSIGGTLYSQNVPGGPGSGTGDQTKPVNPPAKLWFRKCEQVTETPSRREPLNGCKRRGMDCVGACAVGGSITYNKCVSALFSTCTQRIVEKTVTVEHIPCQPIEGSGGAGCKCDTSATPVWGEVTLYLVGC